MKEIETLSGRSTSKIRYEVSNTKIDVEWGKSKFSLDNDMYKYILERFFIEDIWYPLGASQDTPIDGGLGQFIHSIPELRLSPRFASAIAAIMYNEKDIDFRKNGNMIELCKHI
ncbi:MAG: hypothetical protein ACRCX2_16240 [Paraclostridium sp.]